MLTPVQATNALDRFMREKAISFGDLKTFAVCIRPDTGACSVLTNIKQREQLAFTLRQLARNVELGLVGLTEDKPGDLIVAVG